MRPAAPACLHSQVLRRAARTALGPAGLTCHAARGAGRAGPGPRRTDHGDGAPTGHQQVTVTGTAASGASMTTTFAWTTPPPPGS